MPGMVPEDVYELTGTSDPRLSPDGKTIAYSVWWIDRTEKDYRSAVFTVAADGSSAPRRFTGGEKRDGSPRWSPDGSQLAFTSNRGRDAGQLYVIPVSGGGEPVRLTDLKEDVSNPAWSPDGSRIAFEARVRDAAYDEEKDSRRRPRTFKRLWYKLDNVGWTVDRRTHVFVVPVDGSAPPTQITAGDFEDGSPAWSPDGETIAFDSSRHDDWDIDPVRDIYLVPATGGEPKRATKGDGWCEAPSWSADGKRIAYRFTPGVWDEPRHGQITMLDVATGERKILTDSLDRNCAPYPPVREPIWDGDDVVFALEDRGNTNVWRVRADGSKDPEQLVVGEQIVTGLDAVSGRLVHAASTPTTLAEIFTGDRRLTSHGDAFVSGREIVPAERFTATSSDGAEVDCWIVRPAAFQESKKYPVLVNVHGGPFTQYGNKLFDEFQVAAGAGYVVVFCNPRGSSGYAEQWGRAIRGPVAEGPGWGTVDFDDVMAATEEAVRRFAFCDTDRVGIMGGSYGGYMASWAVGHTNRFKAAISERAVNSFVSEWGSSDFGWGFKGSVGAFMFEAPDVYLKLSPATYAQNIDTPLLILHSENDLRCPIEQAEHLFTTLRLLKKDVEFVRFPAESHELTRSGSPQHRVMRFETILDWWSRKL
jgi:dipeptidyl aminopeptidase/acylaminoacyl peptidase